MITLMLTIFIVSVIGLFVIYIYPEVYRLYLNSLFWSLAGTSMGYILGTYKRYKAEKQITRTTFYQIILICIIAITASFVAYMALNRSGIILIIGINIIGLSLAVWMLLRKPKLE